MLIAEGKINLAHRRKPDTEQICSYIKTILQSDPKLTSLYGAVASVPSGLPVVELAPPALLPFTFALAPPAAVGGVEFALAAATCHGGILGLPVDPVPKLRKGLELGFSLLVIPPIAFPPVPKA